MDRGVIFMPDDDEDGDDEDDDAKHDRTSVAFPDDDDPGHKFKALQINMIWEDEQHWHVEAGLWGECNGDAYAERNWEFRVPRSGWESGEWYVYGTSAVVPFMPGWRWTADQGPDVARQLAEGAAGFDRENLIVDGCLDLVRKEKAARP
jgi:hypothetical protein